MLSGKEVDDTIAADWAEIQEKHAVEPETEVTHEAVEEITAEAPVEVKPDRARDETGKFAKAEPPNDGSVKVPPVSAEPRKAVPADASGTLPTPEAADSGIPSRDVNKPPSTWKPTARAEWEKLPTTVRAEIHRREQDFLNGQQQILPDAKFGKSMREVIDPYRMLIEAEGGTPERAVGDILKTAAILRVGTPQQKLNAVLGAAQQFGVDLRAAFAQQQGQQPSQQTGQDPRVDEVVQYLRNQEAQRQQSVKQELESTVTRWMNETDPQGNPLRPYVGDVIHETMAFIPQLRQADPTLTHAQALQAAYDRAVWANPETRALLQQAQAIPQQRVADNQNRVREAKRAASVNVTRRASVPMAGKPGSIDDTLTNTARELGLIT